MSRAHEIYPLDKNLQYYLDRVRNDTHNSKTLYRYYEWRVAKSISKARIVKCLFHMTVISSILKKPFDSATKDDLVHVMAELGSKYADSTFDDFQVVLKQFYKWLKEWDDDDKGFPKEVKWIKRKPRKLIEYKRCVTPEDLLTPDEKETMSKTANHPRDRALVGSINEAGKRPGNILTAHIGDVSFDSLGAKVRTVGKTGTSTMRLISSAPDLLTWINCHPLKDNPDAPLWIVLQGRNYLKQLCHGSAIQMLKRIAKRSGIKRNVYFYLSRYTRIFESMTRLTEDLQCQQFDWVFGSSQPARYKKMFGVHGDDAQQILNGMKPSTLKVELKPELTRPKNCVRCNTSNSPVSKFCNKCGYVLDSKTAMQIDKERQEYEEKLNRLTQDPEKLKKLVLLLEGSDSSNPER